MTAICFVQTVGGMPDAVAGVVINGGYWHFCPAGLFWYVGWICVLGCADMKSVFLTQCTVPRRIKTDTSDLITALPKIAEETVSELHRNFSRGIERRNSSRLRISARWVYFFFENWSGYINSNTNMTNVRPRRYRYRNGKERISLCLISELPHWRTLIILLPRLVHFLRTLVPAIHILVRFVSVESKLDTFINVNYWDAGWYIWDDVMSGNTVTLFLM